MKTNNPQVLQSVREKIIKTIYSDVLNKEQMRVMLGGGFNFSLEATLIALRKTKLGHRYSVSTLGQFFYCNDAVVYNDEIVEWQLGKTLDEQSSDLVKFLNETL